MSDQPVAAPLRLIVVGPGRAGGALLAAAPAAGHHILGVLARRPEAVPAGLVALRWDLPLPDADLVVVAVRDDAVGEVADRLTSLLTGSPVVAHLSGALGVTALAPLAAAGLRTGSVHPLQTLPDAARGAAALAGAWAAVGGSDETAVARLEGFARSLGLRPFLLADEARPAYHAAAAVAANFVVTTLAAAGDLARLAGVPFEAFRPLVEAVIRNVFEVGPEAALTGPVARGDARTVASHLAAARAAGVGELVVALTAATALRAGTSTVIDPLLVP